MARLRRNPFYAVLGIVGFAFTITAASFCVTVLRGVRPETAAVQGVHPVERLIDRHGVALLAAELVVLAIATVGAVGLDHVEGERLRARARAERRPDEPHGGP